MHALLHRRLPSQCEARETEANSSEVVHSVASLSREEGQIRTLARIVWRCLELLCTLGPCLATLPLLKLKALRARWLRLLVLTLERCGPVGIKWGQWASTRYDLFEDDLCDALGALTNAAPVHPIEWTRQVLRDELGCEVSDLFDGFSPEPVASGSIGQVHTAYLRRAHGAFEAGTKVAVKVQHPNLAERLGVDMAILVAAANALDSVGGVSINETVAQFASNFYMQLDFRDEAENLRRFSRHFGSSFWSAIVSFPRPIDDLVSQHVVVETFESGQSVAEYLHKAGEAPKVTQFRREGSGWVAVDPAERLSEKVGDAEQVELRQRVALCGVQAYLKMVMIDNFIHADLHPGNVLVRMEDASWLARIQRWMLLGQSGERVPHIVLLDAGLAANFNQHIYSNVQGFFESIIAFEGPKFGRSILGLSPTQPNVKYPEEFVSQVTDLMATQRETLESGRGRAGDNIREYMAAVRQHQVKLDPSVMVALMSMMVLEGWQYRLDPSTSIMSAIEQQLNRRSSVLQFLL
jgi:aarF domain-containing kinase